MAPFVREEIYNRWQTTAGGGEYLLQNNGGGGGGKNILGARPIYTKDRGGEHS